MSLLVVYCHPQRTASSTFKGRIRKDEPTLAFAHSPCLIGDTLGSICSEYEERLHHVLKISDRIAIEIPPNKEKIKYLNTKKGKIGPILERV